MIGRIIIVFCYQGKHLLGAQIAFVKRKKQDKGYKAVIYVHTFNQTIQQKAIAAFSKTIFHEPELKFKYVKLLQTLWQPTFLIC